MRAKRSARFAQRAAVAEGHLVVWYHGGVHAAIEVLDVPVRALDPVGRLAGATLAAGDLAPVLEGLRSGLVDRDLAEEALLTLGEYDLARLVDAVLATVVASRA